MADDYSLMIPLKEITRAVKEVCDSGNGEVLVTVVDGEVKFINETYKNKY